MTTTHDHHVSPREAGRRLARKTPPITPEQARAAARILATVKPSNEQQADSAA